MTNQTQLEEDRLFIDIVAKVAIECAHNRVKKHPEIKNQTIYIPSEYELTYESALIHCNKNIFTDAHFMADIYEALPAEHQTSEVYRVFIKALSQNLVSGVTNMIKIRHKTGEDGFSKWKYKLMRRYCRLAKIVYTAHEKAFLEKIENT